MLKGPIDIYDRIYWRDYGFQKQHWNVLEVRDIRESLTDMVTSITVYSETDNQNYEFTEEQIRQNGEWVYPTEGKTNISEKE